jgi:glycosyltransferase involved in cell wall biosynthesis
MISRLVGSANADSRFVDLSVLMPCHDEANVVERIALETVLTLRERYQGSFEVFLIDDGSTDGTYERAEGLTQALPELKVLRIPVNGGKGNALRMAFERTSGSVVCFLDGDLDIHANHVTPYVRLLETGFTDVVVGSKRHPQSQVDYPLERRVLSLAYQILVRVLFGLRVRDTQAGIKAFRRGVLERVLPLGLVKRYAFDAELLVLAHRLGYRIIEMPVNMKFREKHGSGVNIRAIYQMLLDTLGVFYRFHVTKYYDATKHSEAFAKEE